MGPPNIKNPDAQSYSQSPRWLTFPVDLTLTLALGVGLPVVGSLAFESVSPEWRWPVFSIVSSNIVNALSAPMFAMEGQLLGMILGHDAMPESYQIFDETTRAMKHELGTASMLEEQLSSRDGTTDGAAQVFE